MGRSVSRRLFLAAAVLSLTVQSPASATDLTGHWLNESPSSTNGTQFDIAQSGDVVTIPLSVFGMPFSGDFEATLTGSTLTTTPSGFRGRVMAGEDLIDGNFPLTIWPQIGNLRLVATRCECFDGNTTNSDGCDVSCHVEPCFECDGDPSICTPLSDGAGCNDHHDCTAGETCSSGACGGGSTVPSCIDMTDRWTVGTPWGNSTYLLEDVRDVEQRDGIVRFRRPAEYGFLAEVGTFDQDARALDLSGGVISGGIPAGYSYLNQAVGSCNMSFSGTVSTDGQSFSGAGANGYALYTVILNQLFPAGCSGDNVPFSHTAHRCTDGDCLIVPD